MTEAEQIEASLRARWERLIPTLKANLIKEMLRDE